MARIWKIINKNFIRFVLSLLQWTSWSDKRRYEQKRKTASSAFKTKWRKRCFQADDHVTFTSSSKRENVAKGISSSRTISWISIGIGDTQVSWFHSTRQHLTPPALVWGKKNLLIVTFIDGDQNKTLLPKVPLEWQKCQLLLMPITNDICSKKGTWQKPKNGTTRPYTNQRGSKWAKHSALLGDP